jgi:PHD/YefM family antitoxin component YafN of YafNO toxin-antitoxin module
MKTLELSAASKPLAEYARDLEEAVVLTKGNKPIAALVSLKNIDLESLSLSADPEFLEIIARAREELAAGKRLSLGAMKRATLPQARKRKPVPGA